MTTPALSLGGPRPSDRIAGVGRALRHEPVLTAVGALGVVTTTPSLAAIVFRGSFVAPEGNLAEAAKFTAGVAVFTFTTALLLPRTGWSPTAKRRWRAAYLVFAVYGLILEPTQAFRGLDPRFPDTDNVLDRIAGPLFGVTALVLVVTFTILGLRFFQTGVLPDRPLLRVGIRYGTLAVIVSFAAGTMMSARFGRDIGEDGDLMVAHMLGVHGIQTIPLTTLALSTATITARAKVAAHIAGVAWLAATTAALSQGIAGRPPTEATALPVLTAAGLALWTTTTGWALIRQRPHRATPTTPIDTSISKYEP
jgi:hypothetical protein